MAFLTVSILLLTKKNTKKITGEFYLPLLSSVSIDLLYIVIGSNKWNDFNYFKLYTHGYATRN